MTKKTYLSWKDIEEGVESLAISIKNSDIKITAIVGMTRGGLVPAVMLSHKLGIPFLAVSNHQDTAGGNYLVVDDICDSGETLKQFKNKVGWKIATLHRKLAASTQPHFCWRIVDEHDWIVYPWEDKDSKAIQDYKTINTEVMQPKESRTNRHFYFSMSKSIVRVFAGFALITQHYPAAGILLVLAEALGIAEEF